MAQGKPILSEKTASLQLEQLIEAVFEFSKRENIEGIYSELNLSVFS
jgi:hypothetical protein